MFDAALCAGQPAEAHGSFIVSFGAKGFRSLIDRSAARQGDSQCAQIGTSTQSPGYAEGFAAGHIAAGLELADRAAQIASLAASLEALQPVSQPVLAGLLAEAVATTLERSLLSTAIDPVALAQSATAMIAAVAAEIEPTVLHLHPDDAALLNGSDLAIEIRADATLARGSLRLATRQGWIEDGPQLRLARFRKALAGGDAA